MRSRLRQPAALLSAFLCLAVALAADSAGAIVPPRDCGTLKVKGRRYDIKADQIRCSTARPYARRYLTSSRRPSGYECRRYSSQTKLRFRCSQGVKVFFAIKR